MTCVRKQVYKSESHALVVASLRLRDEYGPTQLRVYKCPDCGKWHLTKREGIVNG